MATVNSSTSSARLLAPNAARRGCAMENSDANRVYVLLDSGTASATNFTFSLAQNENASLGDYKGEINVIWAADGTGAMTVKEW